MKNILSAVTKILLVTGTFTTAPCARAQVAPPTPPAAVVAEARRIAQLRGVALAPTPDEAELEVDTAGSNHWDLTWQRSEGFVSVYLDQQDSRALSFYDVAAKRAYDAAREHGDTPTYTYNDAIQAFNAIFAELSPPTGNWQIDDRFSSEQITPAALVAKNLSWEIVKALLHDGVQVDNLRVSVSVDPFTGRVVNWNSWKSVVFPATTPGYYGWEWASNTAKAAAAQYWAVSAGAGPYFTSPPSARNLSWLPVSDSTTLNSLFYTFSFTQESNPPFGAQIVQVMVDAVSGEVVYCGGLPGIGAGGDSSTYKLPAPSPRRQLLLSLLNKPKAGSERNPLVLALLGGKPTTATIPSAAARRFTQQVDGKPVKFAFNAARQRLTWQVSPEAWAGVVVSKPDANTLARKLGRAAAAQ